MIRRAGSWLVACFLAIAAWGTPATLAQTPSFSEAMIERTLEPLRSSRPVVQSDLVGLRLSESRRLVSSRPDIPSRDYFIEQTIRRMENPLVRSADCCPCITAPSCDDGLFCNGVETCAAGICGSGVAQCNDQDPCTTDSCAEDTDTCFSSPVDPPSDVAQLDVGTGATSTIAALDWSSVPEAVSYNVYRANSSALNDVACFQGGVTGTMEEDPGIPGIAFFYVVTAESACSESTLGPGNPGLRPAPPVCSP